MNYLVLGSAGQIGKPLCEYLESLNHSVVKFDIVDGEHYDLRKQNALNDIFKYQDIDFVVFLAFDVGGAVYLKKYMNTFEFIQNNIQIMTHTFDTIKKYDIPFIFASSQMSLQKSDTPYGALKQIGDLYTKVLGGLVVKFWNVYGPEEDMEKSHVITDFILKARDNKVIDMLTDGTEFRQFLHAEDCSRCIEILSKKYDDISRKENLHISNFEWHSILDIAKIISKQMNDVPITLGDSVDSVQVQNRVDPSEDILKYWKPKINLEEGIADMINYYIGEMK